MTTRSRSSSAAIWPARFVVAAAGGLVSAYAAQLNGAKWPLLPFPTRSSSRPKPCRCISFARTKARRRPAGCAVLSM